MYTLMCTLRLKKGIFEASRPEIKARHKKTQKQKELTID